MASQGWQRAVWCSRHPVVPASLEPSSPSSPPPAPASLLRTCHCPDGSCSEQLYGAVAGVLEPRAPQIMSPAPRPQPGLLVAPPGSACRPGSRAHPMVTRDRARLQPIAVASGPCWVEQDQGGPRHAEWVTGSGVQMSVGVPVPALPCATGASIVSLTQRGPQIPPAQPGGSAQRWEPCGAAREPLSSRLSPGGGLCSWAEVPRVPLAQPARAGGCWDSWGAGLPCPPLGLQPCGCWGRLERLKMPKPASLELTLLPRQVPPAPGLRGRCLGSTSPRPAVLGHALGWRGSRGSTAAGAARGACAGVPHAPDLRSSIASTPVGAKDGGGPDLGHRMQLDSASPRHPDEQTHSRAAVPGPSIALLQHIGFRSALPAAARLRASPPGAASSVGAVTIPAHHQHPGRSHHHRDVFLPQTPSPREPPLPRRGAGTRLILPVAWPGLGCVVFLFLLCYWAGK